MGVEASFPAACLSALLSARKKKKRCKWKMRSFFLFSSASSSWRRTLSRKKNHAMSPFALEIFPSRVCWEIMGPTAQKLKFPDCAKGREKTCCMEGRTKSHVLRYKDIPMEYTQTKKIRTKFCAGKFTNNKWKPPQPAILEQGNGFVP